MLDVESAEFNARQGFITRAAHEKSASKRYSLFIDISRAFFLWLFTNRCGDAYRICPVVGVRFPRSRFNAVLLRKRGGRDH